MYQLRSYQQQAVDAGFSFLESGEKTGAIIVLPTGAGKSLVIANIAKQLEGKVLILQPSKEILEQNMAKAIEYVGKEDLGVFSAAMNQKTVGNKITFATVGSLMRQVELIYEFSHLIIDECHCCSADKGMYKYIIDIFDGRVLGLTASPYRLACFQHIETGMPIAVAKMLTRTRPRIFKKIIHITQLKELFDKKYLCPLQYKVNTAYQINRIKSTSTGTNFDKDSLEQYQAQQKIVELTHRIVTAESSKHILIFVPYINEGIAITQNLKEIGIKTEIVYSTTPKPFRQVFIESFKKGKIKVIVNVGTLTTGFDFPELDCIILARPTKSVALFYQMIGRGLRVAEGKTACKVFDLCNNTTLFGKIEDFTIKEVKPGLHRLFGSFGPLTGVNLFNGQDLEAIKYKGVESKYSPKNDIVSFGKFKGRHISNVPMFYLKWCVENFKKKDICEYFKKEIERREKEFKEKNLKEVPF